MRAVWTTFVRCVMAVACVLLLAAPAAAQFDRGTISGVVKDQSGAVVPGVTVTAKSLQTQELATAVTDATGYYTMTTLRPGQYEVSAALDGFKTANRSGVTLDGGATIRVEFLLEAGNLSETVTVVASATPIQTDVALRKTVEAKDIELLSFSGRNPIGVPALKPGVVGGNFNNAGFAAFSNGGFNMNGSRADENTITVDGAIAIRTRSAGTIIGVQNVDAVQEVQVLTANYLPEYGRASGGQIRFITKSGSSRYSGSGSFFYRDDQLQANTWARNRSPNAIENSGPAPFDYKQYGYSIGGPIPGEWFKNKLFFFAAQEWVDFFQVATNTVTVPTEAMRNGDFSQLLGANPFYSTPQVIRDPLTGLPFPGNIIPANRLSPNGIAMMKLYPLPTPGFQSGSNNLIQNSENPVDQRKDNLRFDYRLGNNHSFTWRYSKQNYTAIDAFRGSFPFARTDWDRPNKTMNFNWAWTISNNLINEASYSYSIDQVFIDVYTETGLYKRSRTGVNYPYIYPGKEIEDKIPTINIDGFTTIDGGPYPSSSEGPIHLWTDTVTWVKGRHTMKAGVAVEYSGQDDFDQINVNSIPGGTNNQNGQFDFRNTSSGRSGLGIADMALGVFTNYAEIGERARTNWRALATDIFVQDSWRPNEKVTVEGGIRYAIWPPWYSTTNNIANFDPRFYSTTNQAVINPATGRLISGPRYNGIVLPGDGFVGAGNDLKVASDPAVQALFRGEPRGFSQTHFDLFEPRVGMSYAWNDKTVFRTSAGIFHNRVTLNDSTLLGGNPPFQPMVTVSNGAADNPGGVAFANDLPFGMQGQDVVFKLPAAYMWSIGVQRQLPWKIVMDVNYVGRQGRFLQRERNINQLQPGTVQANPGVNIAALRPYKGYGALRVSENSGRSHTTACRSAASGATRTASSWPSPTRTAGRTTTAATSATSSGIRTTTPTSGGRRATTGGTRWSCPTSTTCRSGATRARSCATCSAAGNLGSHVHPDGDALLNHADQRHRGRGRRQQRPAGRPRGRSERELEWPVLIGDRPRRQLRVQPRRVRQPGRRQVRQLDPQHPAEPGRAAVGHRALQELRAHRSAPAAVPRGAVQLHQPSEPQRSERRHHEPELRAHHHEGRLTARRPARAAVYLLSPALG